MIKALARAFRWRKMLHETLVDLGQGRGVHANYISRVLRLTPLSPEIVEAIRHGRQPAELQLDYWNFVRSSGTGSVGVSGRQPNKLRSCLSH